MQFSLICLLLSLCVAVVYSDMCIWHPTFSTSDTEYCAWGCCYSYIYPCCETPFYGDAPFIACMSVGGGVFIIALIVAICVRSRRRNVTAVQYTNTGSPTVFSTSTSTNISSGYSAGYNNHNFTATY